MSTAVITMIDRATIDLINEEHELCERASQDALGHAIEAGKLLTEVKAQLNHGEWLPWIDENFTGSERTAQIYMQVAGKQEVLNTQTSALLSIAGALEQISEPKPKPQPKPAPVQESPVTDPPPSIDQLRPDNSESSPELERRRVEAQTRNEQESTWNDIQRRKLANVRERLEDVLLRLEGLEHTSSLTRASIGEILRGQGVVTHEIVKGLEDLAFSFDK